MNTRLQVEHPVTEAITGQDLVEWQLRRRCRRPLPLKQESCASTAMPSKSGSMPRIRRANFLPSTGTLVHLRLPEEDAHVRVDTGVRQGDTVTPFYDPMIAKVIVHDRDRASAMRRMAALMGATEVVGVTTNSVLLQGAVFASGLRRRRGRYRLHRALSRRSLSQGGARRRPDLCRGDAGATAGMAGRGYAQRQGPAFALGPADRLPAAGRGPRRGALEGRRTRHCRDRPSSARRQPAAGAAGWTDGREDAAGGGRPDRDRSRQRYV